jgi:ubiquinone/menaquinone biosynthesis C-methylase UbiE
MTTSTAMKHGDFTGLAANYSAYRPSYAPSVLRASLALLGKPTETVEVADVGAGTGIWTRMLAREVKSVIAVEPNADMRSQGVRDCTGFPVVYREGSGEATGLGDTSVDLVTMASSFHWVDFDRGTAEFDRILRPGGRFMALWNPRLLEANPLLVAIEEELRAIAPELKRVSSGSGGVTETLTEQLWACGRFDDVVQLEGRHVAVLTRDQYIGAWKSVNDIPVQLGPERWTLFLERVNQKLRRVDSIVATYRTRAWSARKR